MAEPQPPSRRLIETHRRLAVENLKRCPLCGTVNAMPNRECFVCRWRGEFDHRADSVEAGLIDVLERCPELIDCILFIPRSGTGAMHRARRWLERRMRRRLNLEA